MKGVPFEVETADEVAKDVAWLADKKVDIVKIWVDDHFGKERKIPMDMSKDDHRGGPQARAAGIGAISSISMMQRDWWNAGWMRWRIAFATKP